jgi:hypothetical protein
MTVIAALTAFRELDEMSPHKRAHVRQHVDGLSPCRTLARPASKGGSGILKPKRSGASQFSLDLEV